MPSPDLSGYVDLSIYDAQPIDLLDRALTYLRANFPDFVVSEGDPASALLEAAALVVAELVYAINRLPGAMTEILLQLYGIPKGQGAQATATVTFTAMDATGYTVPAGTVVSLAMGTSGAAFFALDANLVIAPGNTTATGSVTDLAFESLPNGTAVGTALGLVESIYFLEGAVLATEPEGGLDPETDAAWLARGSQQLGRLVSTLVLPSHFTDAALESPGVYRATTVDNWDSATDAAANGFVTVAVLGQSAGPGTQGAALSGPEMASLAALLSSEALANLSVGVQAPTITEIDVSYTVKALPGYSAAQVEANVLASLQSWLSTDSWPWTGTVYLNSVAAVILQSAGVAYIPEGDLTIAIHGAGLAAADVALPGAAALAALGTVTPTVT